MVEVFNIRTEYERVLPFLYPTYSVISGGVGFRRDSFICRRDINSSYERDLLNAQYSDCIFLSNRIFDKVLDEPALIGMVLEFMRVNFGSRRRVFRPVHKDGSEFVDELLSFMFGLGDDATDESVLSLFDSYGRGSFSSSFLAMCNKSGYNYTRSSMDTFLGKIYNGSDSLFYKKARARLAYSLVRDVAPAISCRDQVDPYFKKFFPDLCDLYFYMMLAKILYF